MSAVAEHTGTPAALPSTGAVLDQAGSENFPVALRLLGATTRRRLVAIYGFARLVDDIGDEAAGDRTALLAWVDREIERIYGGAEPEHPLMRELALTVRACQLPRDALVRLVQANRQDQVVSRYRTFEQLLGYCQLSAAPVGELVLHVFGQASPERVALSDLMCAGLQVLEHLQDVYEDFERGRIYLPGEDLERFGCAEQELAVRPASPRLRAVIDWEADRTDALLDAGESLARELSGRARLAIAGFLAGGRAALRALERDGFDVSRPRPPRDRTVAAITFASAVAGR